MSPTTHIRAVSRNLRVRAAALVLAIAAQACIWSPTDGEYIKDDKSIPLQGYTYNPGEPIALQAYDKHDGVWVNIASTTTQSQGYPVGGRTWYAWNAKVNLRQNSDWPCFFWADCLRVEGETDVRLRARSGEGVALFTFDQGNNQCTFNAMSSGVNYSEAYGQCQQPFKSSLTLRSRYAE